MPRINQDRLLERFLHYVQVDSESREEAEFAALIKGELQRLGFEVTFDDAQRVTGGNCGNLIAWKAGNCSGTSVLLSAHLDTVAPGKGIKPLVKDGVITSDGTTILGADCKSGVAAILEGLECIKEQGLPCPDVQVIFSVSEEAGLLGAKALDPGRLKAECGFIFDMSGPLGSVVTEAVRHDRLNLDFHGKAAHAGVCPEEGINALVAAANAVSAMQLGRIDEETVANIGKFESGTATNIVPESAHLEGEARSFTDEGVEGQIAGMIQTARKAAEAIGAEVEIEHTVEYRQYKVPEDSPALQLVKRACQATGLKFQPQRAGGGSDANIFNQLGLPSVVLSTGMAEMHTRQEHLAVSDLVTSAELVINLLQAACDRQGGA